MRRGSDSIWATASFSRTCQRSMKRAAIHPPLYLRMTPCADSGRLSSFLRFITRASEAVLMGSM
jgi:hypothetical protein